MNMSMRFIVADDAAGTSRSAAGELAAAVASDRAAMGGLPLAQLRPNVA